MVPEQRLAQSARQAGLRLLVLFGSRVLGNIRGQSDWDFG
jgi:predicted nucleotidyltransferase